MESGISPEYLLDRAVKLAFKAEKQRILGNQELADWHLKQSELLTKIAHVMVENNRPSAIPDSPSKWGIGTSGTSDPGVYTTWTTPSIPPPYSGGTRTSLSSDTFETRQFAGELFVEDD